jgi:hypothetical protein
MLLVASTAGASPTKSECAAAHLDAQGLRRDGRLRAAREKLLVCANEACPKVVTAECVPWLAEVEGALPSVVFEARMPDGTDGVEVAVSVDGARIADRLDGHAVSLDPGDHVVRFDPGSGARAVERHVVVAEGEKARVVRVDLPPLEAAPPPPPPKEPSAPAIPWTAWVLGGTGAIALGAFGTFALTGVSAEHDLRDCSPACPPSRIDPVHRDYVTADIFLGVGLVALAAAAVFVITAPSATPTSRHVPSFDRSMLK